MAVLLALGVLVNYLDRVSLSVALAQIQPEFGLTAVTTGYLLSAYAWSYTGLQLAVGPMLDRFGVRRVGVWAAVLWSVACAGTAAAPTTGLLFGARVLLGVAEAPTFPASAKAIAKWFPREKRGVPTSFFDSAAKLSSAVGVPLMAALVVWKGWRFALYGTAVLSALYAAAFAAWYREPERESEESAQGESASVWSLVRKRKVVAISLAFVAVNYTFYLLLTWLPQYLHTALKADTLHAGALTAIPWAFGAAGSLCVGGWLVDWLIARGIEPSRVRKGVMGCALLLGAAVAGTATAKTAPAATVWITLALTGIASAGPVIWSVPGLIAPPNSTGSVAGIMNFCGNLSGIVAPIATGYIVSMTGSFAAAFWLAGALLLIAQFAIFVLLGELVPVQMESERVMASSV